MTDRDPQERLIGIVGMRTYLFMRARLAKAPLRRYLEATPIAIMQQPAFLPSGCLSSFPKEGYNPSVVDTFVPPSREPPPAADPSWGSFFLAVTRNPTAE
jgi:hypothetical protein